MDEKERGLVALEAGESYTVALIDALTGAGWELYDVSPGITHYHVHMEFEKKKEKGND